MLKLTDILNKPLSSYHNKILFEQMLAMGFSKIIMKECGVISRLEFETYIKGYSEQVNAYVEVFNEINQFRIGNDIIDEQSYSVLSGLNVQVPILIIIQQNSLCTPSSE